MDESGTESGLVLSWLSDSSVETSVLLPAEGFDEMLSSLVELRFLDSDH